MSKRIYKFIGNTEYGLGYKNGKKYTLEVRDRKLYERLLSHYNWRVIIESPIFCPYTSWETFYENWEEL